jgi:hypothetical protein
LAAISPLVGATPIASRTRALVGQDAIHDDLAMRIPVRASAVIPSMLSASESGSGNVTQ